MTWYWYLLIAMILCVVLVGGIKTFLDVQRISRQSKADSESVHALVDPMIAYLETTTQYSEDGFRAYLIEQYGEEGAQRYLFTLQMQRYLR